MNLHTLWHFILHLRPHYQMGVLSGGYLLSGIFLKEADWTQFMVQFVNVHLLLFGGTTAYNSFWDKDEGPIGGLKHPPKLQPWMHPVSLILQGIGMIFGFVTVGSLFAGIYILSMLLFWLYSTPHARWKGHPLLSVLVIAISTGTNSFLLGILAGGNQITFLHLVSSLGVSLILIAMYPISQLFQIEEDRARGDRTFSIQFGKQGVVIFFSSSFGLGTFILSSTLATLYPYLGLLFLVVSVGPFVVVLNKIRSIKGTEDEYDAVMLLKYITSVSFLALIIGVILYLNNS